MPGVLTDIHTFFRGGNSYYRKEDLFTEILAWLLNHDDGTFRHGFASLFIESEHGFEESSASTQVQVGGPTRMRPDLQLEVEEPPGRLVVEVKVDDTLGEQQLRKYHQWLANQPGQGVLGALVPDRIQNRIELKRDDYPLWSRRVYWSSVWRELEKSLFEARAGLAEAVGGMSDPDSEAANLLHYVATTEDFMEMLKSEGAVPPDPLDPGELIALREQWDRIDSRYTAEKENFVRLLRRATIGTSLETRLESVGMTWHRGRGFLRDCVQDQYRQLRVQFRLDNSGSNFLFFGFLLGDPGRAFEPVDRSIEVGPPPYIVAGVHFSAQRARQNLVPGGDRSILEGLARATGKHSEWNVWVPRHPRWQLLVSLHSAHSLQGQDASEQEKTIHAFYKNFLDALEEARPHDGEVASVLQHLIRAARG